MEPPELPSIAGGNAQWYSHFGNQWCHAKLNIFLLYDPAITFLRRCPKELKTCVHTKTHTQKFKAALFRIAKTWKQVR
jgi:hypothetical protein